MDKETKNLYAFGYGVSLLIPFIVTLRGVDHELAGWMILGLFFAILFVVTRMILVKPVFNLWIVALQIYIISLGIPQPFGSVSLGFLGLSILVLLTTIFKTEYLKSAYALFVKVTHFIGSVITAVVLSIMFYLVFGIAGIVLRLLGKDLLSRKIEPGAQSYWVNREEMGFNKADYTRQF